MNIAAAKEARDTGMALSSGRAERTFPGWKDMAFAYVELYARTHESFFPFELVADFERDGYMLPPDDRAFGHVFMRAAKEGLIVRNSNIAKHPRRHAVAVLGWSSLVFRRGV